MSSSHSDISKRDISGEILRLENLSKYYRSYWTYSRLEAVKSVSFSVKEGEAFGFIGHNGAGKTSTIKCIVGLSKPSSGQIFLDGKPLANASQHSAFGYLPEHPYFYDHLSVTETLSFLGSLHGVRGQELKSRVAEVLETVGLINKAKAPVKTLSKGLQQRLGLAQSIINQPRLLILDEPFSGLDPLGRVEVRDIIQSLKNQGTSILMSSHILSDVEDLCDRVAIIAKGEIKKTFSISEAPSLFGEKYILKVYGVDKTSSLLKELRESDCEVTWSETSTGDLLSIVFSDRALAQITLSKLSSDQNISIRSFDSGGARLEDIFIEVTGAGYTK